jgi:hypothetical protein
LVSFSSFFLSSKSIELFIKVLLFSCISKAYKVLFLSLLSLFLLGSSDNILKTTIYFSCFIISSSLYFFVKYVYFIPKGSSTKIQKVKNAKINVAAMLAALGGPKAVAVDSII